MHRRTFLTLGSTTLVGLAGCGSSDGDGTTPTRSRPTTDTAATYLSPFRRDLGQLALDVRHLEYRAPIVDLRYETATRQSQAISDQIGRISGLFFKQVRNGWGATRLTAEASVADDSDLTWYARAAWYDQYAADDLTAEELTLKVLETVSRPSES